MNIIGRLPPQPPVSVHTLLIPLIPFPATQGGLKAFSLVCHNVAYKSALLHIPANIKSKAVIEFFIFIDVSTLGNFLLVAHSHQQDDLMM